MSQSSPEVSVQERSDWQFQKLNSILGKTIMGDENSRLIVFLTTLLTYTDSSQLNVILKGETSVGKSYLLREIVWYFPDEDKICLSGASPKSFVHSGKAIVVDQRTMQPIDLASKPEKGDSKEAWDKWFDTLRNAVYFLDLSKKILVFWDMPSTQLLQNLRVLLSHDTRKAQYDIVDKSKHLRTKTVIIQGFFTTLFATASSDLNEQEASRVIQLSPEDTTEKINEVLGFESGQLQLVNPEEFWNKDQDRLWLKQEVQKIREAGIKEIVFRYEESQDLLNWFREKTKNMSPRAMRDFPRLCGLAEAWALYNWQWREHDKITGVIWVTKVDVEVAKRLYEPILNCNELGLSPDEFQVWQTIKPYASFGLTVQEVHNLYFQLKNRACSDKRLRGMLSNFERAGLLRKEKEHNKFTYYAIKEEKVENETQKTLEETTPN